MKMTNFFKFSLVWTYMFSLWAWAGGGPTSTNNAYKAWSDLSVSGVLKKAKVLHVPKAINKGDVSSKTDEQNIVTFGGEKEGSSSKVTLVLGPNTELLTDMVNILPDDNKKAFMAELLSGYVTGRYRHRQVKNKLGESQTMDLTEFRDLDFSTMDLPQLDGHFKNWLAKSQNKPFSFLVPGVRKKIFHGTFPGMTPAGVQMLKRKYQDWVPHFGIAETFIERATSHHGGSEGGWELNFQKLDSYGDFEKMVSWFKNYLGKDGQPFEAPGHMWMVFPYLDLSEDEQNAAKDKMFEIFRNIQAYIALKGIAGKTGIEVGNFKNVHMDEDFDSLDTDRGILRLQSDKNGKDDGTWEYRFGKNTYAIELRAGTKDAKVQHFVQKVLASRLATHDFGPIQKSSSWAMVPSQGLLSEFLPEDIEKKEMEKMADKYDISLVKIKKFFENFTMVSQNNPKGKDMSRSFLLPLWNWEDAPYLKSKMDLINEITRDFILYVAEDPDITQDKVREGMRSWVKASNIITDIENYLRPQETFKEDEIPHHFPVADKAKVDVNKVDLGIEYSGRFPHKFAADFTAKFDDGKRQWLETFIGYTPEERENKIQAVAKSLSIKLGNPAETPIKKTVNTNGHGHNLGVSFDLKDPQGRKWRVEWDGIGRSYNSEGKVISGSGRSGHIELVTPKFQPTMKEIQTVYEAFAENNVIPSHKAGGGHINVDLAAFDKNPKAFGRFLSLYHQYRGVMAVLFQDIERLKSAEPVKVTKKLAGALKNFEGTEDELKNLLYQERYFNPRVGRKTRYLQLDIGSYFQDVIPQQFISDDFDINNPEILWRPQFRVDPRIRKMEFRLMDAPVTPQESALQMKLVRALMNKAFNEENELSGSVQAVNYEEFVNKPDKAFKQLHKMCADLGLNPEDYEGRMAESLDKTALILKSSLYRPLSERLKVHPRVEDVWGEPTTPRTLENGINATGRNWKQTDGSTLTKPHPLALEIQKIRLNSIKKGEDERADREVVGKPACLRRNLHYIPTLLTLEENVDKYMLNDKESIAFKEFVKAAQKLIVDNEVALKKIAKKEFFIQTLYDLIYQAENPASTGLAEVWQKKGKDSRIVEFYIMVQDLFNSSAGSGIKKENVKELYLKMKNIAVNSSLKDPNPETTVPVPVSVTSSPVVSNE